MIATLSRSLCLLFIALLLNSFTRKERRRLDTRTFSHSIPPQFAVPPKRALSLSLTQILPTMDLLLRNRSPENAYDAKILRDRQTSDRREALLRHQRDEDLMRLNNAWYSKQAPPATTTTSPSRPHNGPSSPRPYGVLSDVKIVSPSKRRSSSSPVTSAFAVHQRLNNSGSGSPVASSPTNLQQQHQRLSHVSATSAGDPHMRVSPSSRQSPRDLATTTEDDRVGGPGRRAVRQSTAPVESTHRHSLGHDRRVVSLSPSHAVGRNEDEYAAATTSNRDPLVRIKMRKAREFSGQQVARLLTGVEGEYDDGGEAEDYGGVRSSEYHNLGSSYFRGGEDEEEDTLAKDLLTQMKWKDQHEKALRKLEMQVEMERVRTTLEDAKSQFRREDEARFAKQQETFKLIEESEKSALEALTRQREMEKAQEALARLEREELEARRMQEHARRREILESRLNRTFPSSSPGSLILLETLPANSPLQEATRRLLEAHADELDVVLPIVQDILNEPEFSASPWL